MGDVETSGPGCISNSSWPTSSTSEEDFRSETPIHVPYFSEYYNPERPTRTMAHCADIYSLLLDHPPRKPVPIGPNHQADIPAWGSQCIKITSNHVGTSEIMLGSEDIVADENEKALMGTCIIPMPDLGSTSYDDYQVGKGRIDCLCEDGGSITCVRQHIAEAREKLRQSIGLERFVELGFLDMGETVADKWSDGDEQLYHKIVYSNPLSSSSNNFWDILSMMFPSRSKMDIVSYYFNVFMLRRRAEQNRCYPINIDSDNDEWQGSEDFGDNETGMSDDDEDSVVESPAYHDDAHYIQNREDDFHVYEEDETCKNNETADFVSGRGIMNISEASSRKLLNSSSSNLSSQLQDNTPWDEKGDQETQDDSCTSSNTELVSQGAALQGVRVKADKNDHWPSNFSELSNGGVHEYVMEPCDAKVWDTGYTNCHENKVDLLPTCSMIEEVFGDGSWNCKARDRKC